MYGALWGFLCPAFWLIWTNLLWVKSRSLYWGKDSSPPNDQILKETSVPEIKPSIPSGYPSANKLNRFGSSLSDIGQLAQYVSVMLNSPNLQNKKIFVKIACGGALTHPDAPWSHPMTHTICTMPGVCHGRLWQLNGVKDWPPAPGNETPDSLDMSTNAASNSTLNQHLSLGLHSPLSQKLSVNSNVKREPRLLNLAKHDALWVNLGSLNLQFSSYNAFLIELIGKPG